jgi:hypothetical protein
MNASPAPNTQGPLLSARKTRDRLDFCPTTIWKLEKEGILVGVTIFSKKYFTLESIETFEQRAMTGEFAHSPRGAAAWPTKSS